MSSPTIVINNIPGGVAATAYMLNIHIVGGSEAIPMISVQCMYTTGLGTAAIIQWPSPFECYKQNPINEFTSLEWGFDSVTRITADNITLNPNQVLDLNFPIFFDGPNFPLQGIIKAALFRDINGVLTGVSNTPDYSMLFNIKRHIRYC